MDDTTRQKKREETFKKYQLDPQKIPAHIAIVMDGNGRWAQKRFLPRNAGHKAGAESLRTTIKTCVELGIRYLTVYVFSTENWKRPKQEVDFLMNLLKELIVKEIPEMCREGARIRCLGAISDLPSDLQEGLAKAEKETMPNTEINIQLMINYGSRREISDACQKISQDIQSGILTEPVSEAIMSRYMYTSEIPDPEILIRTGGDIRVSNYLLWQMAYSELFFLDTLWPDFNRDALIKVVQSFQKRDRRFGGLSAS